jgi:non-heme chloroperoxidase
MAMVKVGVENGNDIHLYYEDHGSGPPVVLIHGYPLNGHSWEKQLYPLLESGHRAITYDRRGFGWSSQPTVGYTYDTLAADLNVLMEHLDLHDAVLVGFSMGTGEVVRYISKYGSDRVRKAAVFGVLPPFLLKNADNPEGVDKSVFDAIHAAIHKDRYAYFKAFCDDLYNVDKLRGKRISDEAWQASFQAAASSSWYATDACIDSWLEDFRDDLPNVDVPVLAMHGTEDRILPFASTAKRLPPLMKDVKLVPVEGGPHNIGWTHAEEVNRELLAFLRD